MTKLTTEATICRIVRTLELITERWPEATARQMLEAARALPAVIADSPLPECLNERAATLYIDDLVDAGALPPWV